MPRLSFALSLASPFGKRRLPRRQLEHVGNGTLRLPRYSQEPQAYCSRMRRSRCSRSRT